MFLDDIVSPLNELSKDQLKNYIRANAADAVQRTSSDSFKSGAAGDQYNKSEFDTPVDRKRERGMDRALTKLAREDAFHSEEKGNSWSAGTGQWSSGDNQISSGNNPMGFGESESRLSVGDPITVTAPNEFEGKTGEIRELSPSGKFVVVDLYNHGQHSMHLSDVEYNQYAADQDELDESAVNPQFINAQVTKIFAGSVQRFDERPVSELLAPVMKEYSLTLQQIDAMYPGGLKKAAGEYGIMMKEGFQDFNKVEPYAVCLAGKPVKQFDYYEQARKFHDNWKQKLYREGDKAKADTITLMPLNLDEAISKNALIGKLQKDLPKVNDPKNKDAKPVKWTGPGKDDYGYTGYQGHGMPTDRAERDRIRADKKKVKEAANPAQQAAIAIAKKKEINEADRDVESTIRTLMAPAYVDGSGGNFSYELERKAPTMDALRTKYHDDLTAMLKQASPKVLAQAAKELKAWLRPVAETALNKKNPQDDYAAKRKALQDLGMNKDVDQAAVLQRRLDLDREARSKGVAEGGNNYDNNRTGFGKRPREDDEYHVPDPVETKYNIKVNGRVINQQPFADRTAALAWAKQAVAAGKLDPKTAMLSPINQVNELSTDKLAQYKKAAGADASAADKRGDVERGNKRFKGIVQATNKQFDNDMKKHQGVAEGFDDVGPVTGAITRRILSQRLDLLKQYGPALVGAAVDNVADYVGDVEEIGSSDVSGWVGDVERMLRDNPPEAFAEAETDYSKRRQRERDVDAGKPVARQPRNPQTDYALKRAQQKKEMELGEDDVEDFVKAGGKITYGKPQRGPRRPGLSLASRHIGGGGDKMRMSRTGRAANTQGKPVVATESYWDKLQTERNTKVANLITELKESIK